MTSRTLFRVFSALCPLILLASCAEMPSTPTAAVPTPTPAGYWNGDGVSGSPRIVVSISEQHAYFYKGKQIVGESTVSTGKPGFGTPPGQYTVVSKDKDHVSSVFGDYVDDFGNVVKSNIDSRKDSKPPGTHYDGARMPYAMFFRGGYAMHQGYVPPYAASHGCIRLPQGMAQPFFENAPVGTPVVVKQEAVKLPPTLPALNPLPAPTPPLLVRPTTSPASVRPTSVRSTVPVQTPVPVRSPSPAPLRSPAPAVVSRTSVPVRSPSPTPVVVSRTSASVRSPAPARSPSPAPVRSPAPVTTRQTPIPMNTPAPASVHPTPTPSPTPSRRHRRVHSRAQVHSPASSPTPTPAR
jgi:L,D-transpeptidase catalytic domain